jgi:hypothetical protein
MRPMKIVAIVIGALLALIGLAMFVPGVFLLGTYGALKDDSGFLQTSSRAVSTDGYALVSPDVDLNIGGAGWEWVPTGGKLAIRLVARGDTQPLFVGIGPSDAVNRYLKGVAYDEISEYGWRSSSVSYTHFAGGAPPSRPSEQTFWVASQEGTGEQDLRWDIAEGNWTAVIMNADASAPVAAKMSLGARFGILLPIAIAITVIGFILLGLGVLLIVLGARRPRRYAPAQRGAGWTPPPVGWDQRSGPSGWQPGFGQQPPSGAQWQPGPGQQPPSGGQWEPPRPEPAPPAPSAPEPASVPTPTPPPSEPEGSSDPGPLPEEPRG